MHNFWQKPLFKLQSIMDIICEQLHEMFTLNFFFKFDESEKIKTYGEKHLSQASNWQSLQGGGTQDKQGWQHPFTQPNTTYFTLNLISLGGHKPVSPPPSSYGSAFLYIIFSTSCREWCSTVRILYSGVL